MTQTVYSLDTTSEAFRVQTNQQLRDFERRSQWMIRCRPMALGALLVRLFAPAERRRIVRTQTGLNLYLDPLSDLGRTILEKGVYEPENAAVFAREIRAGDAVLDVGANEGYFSALAGKLAGEHGAVICVEPQSRLAGVIEINLAINAIAHYRVFQCAIGEEAGTIRRLHLYPEINTGASGFLRKYRLSSRGQDVQFASPESILAASELKRFDFVKVDVEGYECKVVPALLPLIASGKIGKLFLDYHKPILTTQGVDPRMLHDQLIAGGMVADGGDAHDFQSYVLYRHASAAGG